MAVALVAFPLSKWVRVAQLKILVNFPDDGGGHYCSTYICRPFGYRKVGAGLTGRAFNTWLKALTIPVAQEAVLTTNLKKAKDWWANQPSSAHRAKSGDHDGHPSPKTQQEL